MTFKSSSSTHSTGLDFTRVVQRYIPNFDYFLYHVTQVYRTFEAAPPVLKAVVCKNHRCVMLLFYAYCRIVVESPAVDLQYSAFIRD